MWQRESFRVPAVSAVTGGWPWKVSGLLLTHEREREVQDLAQVEPTKMFCEP